MFAATHIYRYFSRAIKTPPHAFFSSVSPAASSSSFAQQLRMSSDIKQFVDVRIPFRPFRSIHP